MLLRSRLLLIAHHAMPRHLRTGFVPNGHVLTLLISVSGTSAWQLRMPGGEMGLRIRRPGTKGIWGVAAGLKAGRSVAAAHRHR